MTWGVERQKKGTKLDKLRMRKKIKGNRNELSKYSLKVFLLDFFLTNVIEMEFLL